MTRSIVAPPDLTGAPLTELKSWLAISTAQEDALLTDMLHAACGLCESFTGLVPLATTIEERVSEYGLRQSLRSLPVRALVTIERVAADGIRTPVAGTRGFAMAADGSASLDTERQTDGSHLAVRIVAGMEEDWAALQPPIAQGIIRMAAHSYRERDLGPQAAPPSAVAALWRPFRRMRL